MAAYDLNSKPELKTFKLSSFLTLKFEFNINVYNITDKKSY